MNPAMFCLWLTGQLMSWCGLIVINLSFCVENGLNPWNWDFRDFEVFLWNWLRNFVPHSVRNLLQLIALDLDFIWPPNRALNDFSKWSFALSTTVLKGQHAHAHRQKVWTARAGEEHAVLNPLFIEHARAWWIARPCLVTVNATLWCVSTTVLLVSMAMLGSWAWSCSTQHAHADLSSGPC